MLNKNKNQKDHWLKKTGKEEEEDKEGAEAVKEKGKEAAKEEEDEKGR